MINDDRWKDELLAEPRFSGPALRKPLGAIMPTYVTIRSADAFVRLFPVKPPSAYEGPGLYNKDTGYQLNQPKGNEVCMPMVMRDIPEYRSPIDGKMITSRSERREDLIRNNCTEVDPPKKGTRHFKNEKWARKRGLPLEL